MPTPIVHICVADKLITMLNVSDKASFILGSIAPDAVFREHTYYDVSGYDEEYNKSHFVGAGYDVWRGNVKEFLSTKLKNRRFDFYLGNAVHILTDILWHETLYREFKSECIKVDMTPEDTRTLYYRDMAILESILCRQIRLGSSALSHLDDSVSPPDCPNLDTWRGSVLELFNKHPDGGVIKYFTVGSVAGFIAMAATEISRFICDIKPERKQTTAKRGNQEFENALLDYFETQCVGAENVVSSKFLEARFSVSGEKIRSAVNHLRCSCVPICSDRTGYWYAGNTDELRVTINQLRSRVRGILNAVTGLEVSLLKAGDGVSEEFLEDDNIG